MTAQTATLAERCERLVNAEVLVVLTEDAQPPRWAVDWCRRSGRELRVEELGPRQRHSPPALLADDVADLVGHPVLVVRRTPARPRPPRVIAAIRDLPRDAAVLADAEQAATHLGADLVIAHGVPRSFAERSIGLAEALDRGRNLLDRAARQASLTAPDLEVTPRLLRVRPHELVRETFDAELFVVGVPATRRLSGLDPVATSALVGGHCPVLLVPKWT
jgi:hypothetical protein